MFLSIELLIVQIRFIQIVLVDPTRIGQYLEPIFKDGGPRITLDLNDYPPTAISFIRRWRQGDSFSNIKLIEDMPPIERNKEQDLKDFGPEGTHR